MRFPRLRPLAVVLGPVLALGLVTAPASSAQESDDGGLLGGVLGGLTSPRPSEPAPAPAPAPAQPPAPSLEPAPEPAPADPAPSTETAPSLLPADPGLLPKPAPPASSSGTRPGPGRAWTLTASTLELHGSRYRGVVERQVGGSTVRTLHFTVDRLDITDLVQRGELGNGRIIRAAGRPGSTSTVTRGPVELYTQELTGTLAVVGHPLARTTLSADSLAMPDLDLGFLKLPDLTFRDVVVHNTDLSGGTLTIPGSEVTLEP